MKALANLISIVGGIVSFLWSMHVIVDRFGFLAGCVAFFVFPLAIALVPFYLGFSTGDWTLFAVTYGAGILSVILFAVSKEK